MSNDFILLVCGFGRCGSSLVMQMLHAGGYPTTGEYPAFEDAIALPSRRNTDDDWRRMIGRAVKVIDPHHVGLPQSIPFRAIWLNRDREEQAKSHAKFLAVFEGIHIDRHGRRMLTKSYGKELPSAARALEASQLTLTLGFEGVLSRPEDVAASLGHMVGDPFDAEAAARVVRRRGPECYPGMLEAELIAVSG